MAANAAEGEDEVAARRTSRTHGKTSSTDRAPARFRMRTLRGRQGWRTGDAGAPLVFERLRAGGKTWTVCAADLADVILTSQVACRNSEPAAPTCFASLNALTTSGVPRLQIDLISVTALIYKMTVSNVRGRSGTGAIAVPELFEFVIHWSAKPVAEDFREIWAVVLCPG